MPVRKIGKSARSMTGIIANEGQGVAYESSLERDLFELLRFDVNVDRFEEQPVKIEYKDAEGKPHHYTPDVLVKYRRDIVPAKNMRPFLAEVKYRADLFAQWKDLKPRLKAGRAYARTQGWDFKILTENEIRTPFLTNVKFLNQFRRRQHEHARAMTLLDTLDELREADPETLLLTVCQDRWNRAQLIPELWRLVAHYMIGCDLNTQLTMRSRIWSLSAK